MGLAMFSGHFIPFIHAPSGDNMATSKRKGGSGARSQPVAIEMLVADHRSVDELFDRYESEKESDDDTKRAIAQRICGELTVHAQVEEELFYPWLRENLDDDEMELVEEAQVEHQTAKDLIAQIEGGAQIDESYDAKVKVLGEYIRHHVEEEEGEIFPAVSSEKEALDELGQEMMARKLELMEELGLNEEEDGSMLNAKSGKPGSRSQQDSQRQR
jgi:hemerythrin superfamily protein